MSAPALTAETPSGHGPADFPTWTARVLSDEAGGRFPLALEAVGANMVAAHLLHAVTNATPHPRYYSFFAWAFGSFDHRLAKTIPESQRAKAQRRWRARLEHALRACTLAATPEIRQLVGSRTAVRVAELGAKAPVRLSGKAPSGFNPENYGAGFMYMGLGERVHDRIHLSRLGWELAEAFDTTLRTGMSSSERRALDILFGTHETVPARVLHELTDRLRIRAIAPAEREHAPLTSALFRLDPDHQQPDLRAAQLDRSRAHGLGLILDLARQGGSAITSYRDLFQVFATRRFGDGRAVSFDDAGYARAFGVWERFMERQGQKTVINALWHETLRALEASDPHPLPAAAIVGHCHHRARRSATLANWLGPTALARTVVEARAEIEAQLPSASDDVGALVYELAEAIRDTELPGDERVGRAVVLLFVVLAHWQRQRQHLSEFHRGLHHHGGAARLTLPWMFAAVEQRGHDTIAALIQWLVEWCVLSQAIRVAYEKLDDGDRFFVERVDGGYRLAQESRDPRSYFDFDSSRLHGATSILRNLGLVRGQGSMMLSAAGETFRGAIAARGSAV